MFAFLLALLGGLGAAAAGGGGGTSRSANTDSASNSQRVPEPDPASTASDAKLSAVSADTVEEPDQVMVVTDRASEQERVADPEPEPVIVVADPEPVQAPVVVVADPEPQRPVESDPEPEPVVVVADPEPVQAPVVVVADPEPQRPVASDPEPEQDPIPVVADPEPVLEPVIVEDNAEIAVISGRTTRIELPDSENIASVEIIEAANHGNVTVNSDNSLSVVLTNSDSLEDLSFKVEILGQDGTQTTQDVQLNVEEGTQLAGWGQGDFYMLETDTNNAVIVEHGENHQKLYVSGHEDALTVNDIALIEGIDASQVNQKFFLENPHYGATEDMALAEDAGQFVWRATTGNGKDPSSNWLLLERGYEYETIGDYLLGGTAGESELHPIYFGAYGEGEKPVILDNFRLLGQNNENIVIQDLHFQGGIDLLSGENYIIDNIETSGESTINVQNVQSFTLRESEITDVVKETPHEGEYWEGVPDRVSGFFTNKSSGILVEDNLFDHSGWEADYSYDRSADFGQAPSKYSHNIYIQTSTLDVTIRDNIIMQAASTGAQVRGGGFIEDNIFIDNNGALMWGKGGSDFAGNYTLAAGNVITSGAHKEADHGQGSLTKGITNQGSMSTLIDNIVAHLADPNNPDELAAKEIGHDPLEDREGDHLYDDTIIHNWVGSKNFTTADAENQNTEDLDYNVLNETTIQLFAADVLNDPDATIQDLAAALRQEADGSLDDVVDADVIIAFFQQGFGITPDLRSGGETLTFTPNELADGVRWDNRLNWDSDDLPGTYAGDSVDLAGNWVLYSGTNTLEDLDFGDGGKLAVSQGYLQIDDHVSVGDAGAELSIDKAGQVWLDGYTDQDILTIEADGGRLANTGLFTGSTDLNISDNAQVLLATSGADFALNGSSTLSIVGDDAQVGFDSDDGGVGVLLLADDATLSFTAQDGLGEISEFRSGKFDNDAPDILSGVNLGDAELKLDISELSGGEALSETLIEADEIIGTFGSVDITGLSANQDATVAVDYDADTVILSLSTAGSGTGQVSLLVEGNESSAEQDSDLWDALTNGHGIYPDDPAEGIPAEEDTLFDL